MKRCSPRVKTASHWQKKWKKRIIFTLIELLLIVAILAILLSMLIPALEKARGMAKRASCLNNQKQLGLAINMYTNDYDGFFPYFTGGWTSLSIVKLFEPHNNYLPNANFAKNSWGEYYPPLLHCEADPRQGDDGLPQRTFAQSGAFTGIQEGGLNAVGVRTPSRFIIVAPTRNAKETDLDWDWGWYNRLKIDGDGDGAIMTYHTKGANFLFGDGHANWHDPYRSGISSPLLNVNDSTTWSNTGCDKYWDYRL